MAAYQRYVRSSSPGHQTYVMVLIIAVLIVAHTLYYFGAHQETLDLGVDETLVNTPSNNDDIMEANLKATEQCQPQLKANFQLSMTDIHSTNPYKNFSPSSYGIKGRDLAGWGIDEAHAKIMDKIRPKFMVEVGSWKGLSVTNFTKQMRQYYSQGVHNNECIMLICVDMWLGTTVAWENADMEHPKYDNTLYLRNGYPSVYYQFLYISMISTWRISSSRCLCQVSWVPFFLNRKNARPDTIEIDPCNPFSPSNQ